MLAARLIKNSGASIIGVQEMLPQMKTDVENLLSDYSVFGTGRFSGTKPKNDEHSDIIVKNQDVEVEFIKTFWLSKHPERGGSRALFSFFPRICTVAEVYLKTQNRRIRVFNTHFDHISGFARTLGTMIILKYMNEFNRTDPLPTILMGDMNCKSKSKPIKTLRYNLHTFSNIHLKDVYEYFDPQSITNTYHSFKGKIKLGASPIDYIFVSDEFEVVESHIDTKDINGKYPSDHFPLVATLRLKDMCQIQTA